MGNQGVSGKNYIGIHLKKGGKRMEQKQNVRESSQQDQATDGTDAAGAFETTNGMATTQEQVSDMYKMGTIEDRGSTR